VKGGGRKMEEEGTKTVVRQRGRRRTGMRKEDRGNDQGLSSSIYEYIVPAAYVGG